MIQISDLKIIIHLFIHNPKEVETGRKFIGNFPKGKSNSSLLLVKQNDLLTGSYKKEDWLLFDGKSRLEQSGYLRKVFYYINNPDGTIRWIYPGYLKKPMFLAFYAKTDIRARLIALFYWLSFATGFKKIVSSGAFTVYKKIEYSRGKHFLFDGKNRFAIFTGTVGPNRKAVLIGQRNKEHNENSRFFVKIPLTKRALDNILHEDKFLSEYNPPENTIIPVSRYWNDPPYIFLSDIKPKGGIQNTRFDKPKINFIVHNAKNSKRTSVKKCEALKESERLFLKTDFSRLPGSHNLKRNLEILLSKSLSESKYIYQSVAHGDFTPWNCYTKGDQLYLFDWELAKKQAPLFFDLYHFFFQKGIMVEHKNFKQIKEQSFKMFDDPSISWIIQKKKISPIDYLQYYLILNVSYYLYIYSIQEKLHRQVKWQINVWDEALEYLVQLQYSEGYKGVFIENLRKFLSVRKYAIIKRLVKPEDLVHTNNDLDLLVKTETANDIYSFCKNDPGVTYVKRFKRSYMHTLEIYFDDLSFLRIDLLLSVRRKTLVFLDSEKALSTATMAKNGWKYILPEFELSYVKGFYWLNGDNIPERYVRFYGLAPEEISVSAFKKFKNTLINNPLNKWHKRLGYLAGYIVDIVKHISFAEGIVITYSGVDGAGKTTVLSEIAKTLKNKYRKEVVVLRHRPSVLPIISAWFYGKEKAERLAASQLPHEGTNKNVFSSYVRFFYYLTDYLLGQFYIYIKYVTKGYLVIYDRYYFDFISDPKRSNMVVNTGITRFFYRFLIKPKFNFFLYADADEILSRKKELSKEKIIELTNNYRKLFSHYNSHYHKSRYVIIKNSDLKNTIKSIEREFVYHQN